MFNFIVHILLFQLLIIRIDIINFVTTYFHLFQHAGGCQFIKPEAAAMFGLRAEQLVAILLLYGQQVLENGCEEIHGHGCAFKRGSVQLEEELLDLSRYFRLNHLMQYWPFRVFDVDFDHVDYFLRSTNQDKIISAFVTPASEALRINL